jgi:hypothetical protein
MTVNLNIQGNFVAGTLILATNTFVAIDGSLAAPVGATAQIPNLFTGFSVDPVNGPVTYPVRPPWKVAGVDYGVGPSATAVANFLDWTTIGVGGANSIPGVTINSGNGPAIGTNSIYVSGATAVILNAIDFSLHSGAWIYIDALGTAPITITNNKFGGTGARDNSGRGPVTGGNDGTTTISYNFFDLAGVGDTSNATIQVGSQSCSLTVTYNYARNGGDRFISEGPNLSLFYAYNLLQEYAQLGSAAHYNLLQGFSPPVSPKVQFNTVVQNQYLNEGLCWQFDLQNAGNVNNPTLNYCTCIAHGNGSSSGAGGTATMGFWVSPVDITGDTGGPNTLVGTGSVQNNYFDRWTSFNVFYTGKSGTWTQWTIAGNIDLLTGGPLNTPGSN